MAGVLNIEMFSTMQLKYSVHRKIGGMNKILRKRYLIGAKIMTIYPLTLHGIQRHKF